MIRALVVALCLVALPAAAFEGVLHTRMSSPQKLPDGKPFESTGTIQVKGLNSRMESSGFMGGSAKHIAVTRASEPGVTYILYPEKQAYTKFDSKKDKPDASDTDDVKWTIKRLGKDKVAGRTTEHVLFTKAGSTDETEAWIDQNLVSEADIAKILSGGNQMGQRHSWWAALKKEGLSGIPIKFVHREKDKPDHTVTFEVTEVKSQSIPDSAFAIPSGWKEIGFGEGMMTADQQKQMKDQMQKAMEKMTPEQRKQFEEMMKQHGGGH